MEDIIVKLFLGLIIFLILIIPIITIYFIFKKLEKNKQWKKRPIWLKLGLKVLSFSWGICFTLTLISNFIMQLLFGKIDISTILYPMVFSLIFSLPIAIIAALISYFKHRKK